MACSGGMSVDVRWPQEHENAWIERYLRQSWGIPLVGEHGIPIHDELAFELVLR